METEPKILTPLERIERDLLGACFFSPVKADYAAGLLDSRDFSVPFHREVFAAISHLSQQRVDIEPLSVAAAMRSQASPVFDLMAEVTGAHHVEHHSALVLAASKVRALRSLGEQIVKMSEKSNLTVDAADAIMDHAVVGLDEIQHRTIGKKPALLSTAEPDLVPRIVRDDPTPTGLTTGFIDLDRGLGGLRDGEMIVLAARPSVGKSLFAANIAENLVTANHPSPVLFISLEMSSQQLYRRYLFGRSGVPQDRALAGQATKDEKDALIDAHLAVVSAPWYVHFEAQITAQRVHSLARRFRAKHGPFLLVVDYLQLMSGPGQSRYEVVTNLSAAMKGTAVDLGVPVLVLAQLNRQQRDVDGQVNIPVLSDLRDSGAIEQDADVVIFLARNHLNRESHATELVIAKNRPGRTGKTQILFDVNGPRFRNISKVESW